MNLHQYRGDRKSEDGRTLNIGQEKIANALDVMQRRGFIDSWTLSFANYKSQKALWLITLKNGESDIYNGNKLDDLIREFVRNTTK